MARNGRVLLTRFGLRRRRKVFAVGFNKSGTTSLHGLFQKLGLLSFHGTTWRDCADLTLLRSYDCFSDDIPADLAKLDTTFPGSRFILQVRELDTWVYSRLAHISRNKRDVSYKTHPRWDTTQESVEGWIKLRNQHHTQVLNYFAGRPSDLLVVNLIRDREAAAKIGDFLGYDAVPQINAKNVNSNRMYPSEPQGLLKRSILSLGVPAAEVKNDILCPSLLDDSAAHLPVDSKPARGQVAAVSNGLVASGRRQGRVT